MKILLHLFFAAIAFLALGDGLLAQQSVARTGTLLVSVPVPVVINGKQVGNATLAKGLVVSVLREDGERVLVGNAMGSTWITKGQIALAAIPAAVVPTIETPCVAPASAAAPSTPVTERKPKVLLCGMGAFYDRAFVRDELRKAGCQVDEKYIKTEFGFNKPQQYINPVTEADIEAYDVFWFDSLNASLSLSPELFQKLLKTRNKLVIISRTHDPIPEIRKYGTLLDFPSPNPYSSAKTLSKNHMIRGVKVDGDVNVVESEEGHLNGCDIITSLINIASMDTTKPAIGQPAYAAQAQRTLLPEILKYMKRLKARLH